MSGKTRRAFGVIAHLCDVLEIVCGIGPWVGLQPSKLAKRVRVPYSAPVSLVIPGASRVIDRPWVRPGFDGGN